MKLEEQFNRNYFYKIKDISVSKEILLGMDITCIYIQFEILQMKMRL